MGIRIGLSNGRRLVDDVIRVAAKMPMASVVRDMDLAELSRLRKQLRPKLSWNIIFMKAYSIVARENPELRQVYVPFPWPHLYQHDDNVCFLTLGKEYRDETRLVFARFTNPESRTLMELHEQFEHFRRCEIDEVKQFRHQIAFARCPSLFRRFVWWALFGAFPKKRVSNMGTFGMSISCMGKTKGVKTLGPASTIVAVDHMPRKGQSYFLYTFDHRILDGRPASRMVEETLSALNGPILEEVKRMLEQQKLEGAQTKSEAA